MSLCNGAYASCQCLIHAALCDGRDEDRFATKNGQGLEDVQSSALFLLYHCFFSFQVLQDYHAPGQYDTELSFVNSLTSRSYYLLKFIFISANCSLSKRISLNYGLSAHFTSTIWRYGCIRWASGYDDTRDCSLCDTDCTTLRNPYMHS